MGRARARVRGERRRRWRACMMGGWGNEGGWRYTGEKKEEGEGDGWFYTILTWGFRERRLVYLVDVPQNSLLLGSLVHLHT